MPASPDQPAPDHDDSDHDDSPDQIEAEIARTRRELGKTVGALSAKLDAKAQAGEQVEHLKETARDQLGRAGVQLDRAREAAGEQLDQARETAGVQLDRARERARSTVDQAKDAAAHPEDHPEITGWVAAAAGAAVFAVIGLLIVQRLR